MQAAAPNPPSRLASIDAYRGFVMLLMAGEVLNFGRVSQNLPNSGFWEFLENQQSHVQWRGCTLHDLIQPSFSFLVGAALPWSIASRGAKGEPFAKMLIHTLWRAFVLIAMGVLLRSTGSPQTNYTFEDTLSQIGLGYVFLWLLAWTKVRTQILALIAILLGYWVLFALWPLPGPGFDPTTVGVEKDWPSWMSGFAAHWNKNTNPAFAFDHWFLNLFPRPKEWLFNGGGYSTLSFIPTLGTMILGLLAGEWIRRADVAETVKVRQFLLVGLAGLAAGWLLDVTHICPSVKRIWTPSWVLFSGGWASLLLGMFYGLTDVAKYRRWAFPLLVVGTNSIFMYCAAHLWEGFLKRNLKTHLGQQIWESLGGPYSPLLEGIAVLGILWLCCLYLWKHKMFIRV
ncbi:MAG TPA: hypothetical protein VMF06_00750 [Candidatus Limnocylindria bacterium]|jgi:predicted acyltransferase|nr:hypothetical protein [Candidatus Limnocylindria bacterium]